MSRRSPIPREHAMEAAYPVIGILQPLCIRVEFAGSIRRMRPAVGDVEIVCVPKIEHDLFGDVVPAEVTSELKIFSYLERGGYTMIKNGPYFKQFDLGPCLCDLFLTTPEKWGIIYLLRTGSEEYAHHMVTPRQKYGYMPSNLAVKDGRLWKGTELLETPEEEDVYRYYGIPYLPPFQRLR